MPRNPITMELLETLDAIDRRGSFAKAAEELNKATSAVSYTVQKLEEQLDLSLFQRQGRRSVLTPAGELMLAEGRSILRTTERLANQAKEVATGWEPRVRIGIESMLPYSVFFTVLQQFLEAHPSVDIDVCECVLNGGWEALSEGRVDLIVGSPGPVPLQKGFRSIPVAPADLVAVIAASHPLAKEVSRQDLSADKTERYLAALRRVITHDTSVSDVARSAGLSSEGKLCYVQTIDQKVEAIRAGMGVGHLPRHRVQHFIDSGELLALNLGKVSEFGSFIAWKASNKGRGVQVLSQQLAEALK